MIFGLILYKSPGPNLYFSNTPGRYGSIIISIYFINYLRIFLSYWLFNDNIIDFLFLFIILFSIAIDNGTGSGRLTKIT